MTLAIKRAEPTVLGKDHDTLNRWAGSGKSYAGQEKPVAKKESGTVNKDYSQQHQFPARFLVIEKEE